MDLAFALLFVSPAPLPPPATSSIWVLRTRDMQHESPARGAQQREALSFEQDL